jgi:Mrp family chromosome partitioning ATPase
MRRRASNVYGRPLFLARVGGVAFALTLLAFAFLAHSASRAEVQGTPRAGGVDTALLRMAEQRTGARLSDAENALAAARAKRHASAIQRDAIAPEVRARRDSLAAAAAELTRLLERSDDAPLVASFRALGTAAPMMGEPRVARLVDSLNDLDKARSDFGSSDGVDPIFVALTARVGSIGHELEALARAKRAAMHREIESLTPPPVLALAIDTVPLEASRDSAARAHAEVAAQLVNALRADSIARARDDNGPGIFGVGIPTLVLAAGVVATVLALAIALMLELRWPTVSDVSEAESLSGTRVLVTIAEKVEEPQRQRRSSDREIPPSIEQSSDAYRLLYGQLADATFDLTVIAVAGDHPFVTTSVAANLAAIAARSGRPTLLLDTDFRVQPVAKMVGIPATPGVADVLAQRVAWAGAVTSVLVSRGRSIDVLPSGMLTGTLQAVTEQFSTEVDHLTRRYETVVVSASTPEQGTITVAAGAVGEVVICLRRGRSTHASLRAVLAALEASGARVRGIVLWDRADPAPPEPGWGKKRLELVG